MPDEFVVALTRQEQEYLKYYTREEKRYSRAVTLARCLLMADVNSGSPSTPQEIARTLGMSPKIVEKVKRKYVESGIYAALDRRPTERGLESVLSRIKFEEGFEDRLLEIARSDPPEGRKRWSIRLLAEKAVENGLCESISTMTVHRMLKKANFKLSDSGPGRPPKNREAEQRP